MASAVNPIWSPRGDELMVLGRRDAATRSPGALEWWILPIQGGAPRETGAQKHLRDQNLGRVRILPQLKPTALAWKEDNGFQVIFAASYGDVANLWEIDLGADGKVTGAARPLTATTGRTLEAAWSHDTKTNRLAFTDEELNFDVWALPIDAERGAPRGEMRRITENPTSEWSPSITFDGTRIAYAARLNGLWAVRTREMATGRERTLASSASALAVPRISGDGSLVAYSNNDAEILTIATTGGAVTRLCAKCGSLMGVSNDGSSVTYEPFENEDLLLLDPQMKTIKLALQPDPGVILSSGQFSQDSRWIAFHSLRNAAGTSQVSIVPVNAGRPLPQSEWIAVTDDKHLSRDPAWAPGGGLVYFVSDSDGFRCVWARRLDPASKKPLGEAFAVQHFHNARRSLSSFGNMNYLCGLSVGANWLTLSLGERTGNIWLRESQRAK